jgi:nucleotidyltransferase substrate binding protein (TIGR01987 family)
MTKEESLKQQFRNAVARLIEVLQEKKTDIIRDSAIQRFEFTFDLSWKVLKEILEVEYGVTCASPKKCLRDAYKQGIITYDDLWMDMTDWRNAAVHTYNEELADSLYEKLPRALEKFKYLAEQIK